MHGYKPECRHRLTHTIDSCKKKPEGGRQATSPETKVCHGQIRRIGLSQTKIQELKTNHSPIKQSPLKTPTRNLKSTNYFLKTTKNVRSTS